MREFGLPYFARHQETTTWVGSGSTSPSVSTDKTPWHLMYKRDKYARDRVMKSACLLRNYIKEGDTVLDVGCFTQEASKYFGKFVKYIGLDVQKYHPNTIEVDLNHGFPPQPCQGALCLETLEHLVDPSDTMKSLSDSLGKDSYLVVSLPNEATIFHRIRSLLGTVDAGCFSSEGKHLHLPSLSQARQFLDKCGMQIHKELYYISPTACGSQNAWIGRILSLIPDCIHQWCADRFPSLFARGFIFLLKKKVILDNNSHQLPVQSQPS